jgi:RNA polymerase sigma-70 factor (ECF subfamily)
LIPTGLGIWNLSLASGVLPAVVGRPLAEEELVERARRGDAAAYEELVRTYQGIAFRTAYLLAGNAADAEEAAQDGFVKAYRALGRFRTGLPFRPWLLKIVANEARNRRRSAGRREQLALRAAAGAAPGDAAPSPEAALLSAERRDELLAALNRLPERDRLVLACRYLLDLSEEESAAALGCRRGTVKSRLARALERLRADLGETDG